MSTVQHEFSPPRDRENQSMHLNTANNERPFPWWRRLRHRIGELSLRDLLVWWRHRGFIPADVFIATYPRSGYTWLKFMVFSVLTGEVADFQKVSFAFRYVGEHSKSLGLLPAGGRFISTHEVYSRHYKRAIYIVRDVRNVAVSEFLRERAKGIVTTFDQYLDRFLRGAKRHGSWPDHVASYLNSETAKSGNLLLLRYEDMRQHPEQTLVQVLDFLKVPYDSRKIRQAVEDNTIERMRQKEDAARELKDKVIRRPFKGIGGDDGRFVRVGSLEGWREWLTPEQLRAIEEHAGECLVRAGYKLSGEHATGVPAALSSAVP
jgi:sulfotransferase family protein